MQIESNKQCHACNLIIRLLRIHACEQQAGQLEHFDSHEINENNNIKKKKKIKTHTTGRGFNCVIEAGSCFCM